MAEIKLTLEQRKAINMFLFALPSFTRSQWEHSYPQWLYGGRGWGKLQQGGTGIMRALMWYHHTHKPGSREWRPAVIIRALIQVVS
jgi:hypothetical protein